MLSVCIRGALSLCIVCNVVCITGVLSVYIKGVLSLCIVYDVCVY